MKLTANKLKSLILEVLSEERDKLDVVIVGGFKPPHKGHYHFIKFYLDNPNVDKVVVISGDKEREGITFDDTKRIFGAYGLYDDPKFVFRKAKTRQKKSGGSYTNPFLDAVTYSYFNKGKSVGFGHSSKDAKYQDSFIKAASRNGNAVEVPMYEGEFDTSATNFREALRNGESIKPFIPEHVDEMTVLSILDRQDEVLKEVAKTPTDLPWDVFITIDKGDINASYAIYYSDEDGNELKYNNGKGIAGAVVLEKPPYSKKHPCNKGYMVAFSDAAEGYGPLLYDVAMEIATIEGGGMISDRLSVSDDAYGVWEYYLNKRSDVKNSQLDDEKSTLTPDIKVDDCMQASTEDHENKVGGDWTKSPLSKIYSKPPTTLQELEQAGRLIKKVKLEF